MCLTHGFHAEFMIAQTVLAPVTCCLTQIKCVDKKLLVVHFLRTILEILTSALVRCTHAAPLLCSAANCRSHKCEFVTNWVLKSIQTDLLFGNTAAAAHSFDTVERSIIDNVNAQERRSR